MDYATNCSFLNNLIKVLKGKNQKLKELYGIDENLFPTNRATVQRIMHMIENEETITEEDKAQGISEDILILMKTNLPSFPVSLKAFVILTDKALSGIKSPLTL